ncbi:Fungalysin metallopeptidase-domain-containing protein [Cladochytrium replicatum]|nr:Fungalysin metallopeptidase-domain-containing protein [Cladochytrium replicatum]
MKGILLATIALAAGAVAAPTPSTPVKRLPAYFQPESAAGAPVIAPPSFRAVDPLKVASDYLKKQFGLRKSDYVITGSHTSDARVTHIYIAQTIHGIQAANAVANINVASSGSVISMYQSFVPIDRATSGQRVGAPAIDPAKAVAAFALVSGLPATDALQVTPSGSGFIVSGASFTVEPIKAKDAYYQTQTGLVRTWELSVHMPDLWQNVFVDSSSGTVVGVATWTSDWTESYENIAIMAEKRSIEDIQAQQPSKTSGLERRDVLPATYDVIPLGKTDPLDNGGKLTTVVSPWSLPASPDGWHVVNGVQTFETRGNNVIAQLNPKALGSSSLPGLPRPNSTTLTFQYAYDGAKEPTIPEIQAASTVNVFYCANSMHDLFYNYGFDEPSGNFQTYNYGKGGAGNDAVFGNAQDGSDTDNANFSTPPDGSPGIMRMFLFTFTTPKRDGGFATEVIAHEMTHGLSNRLTGGPANANCLQTSESGGMGEGWSDAFALFVTQHDDDNRNKSYPTGAWVVNNPNGIRSYPYNTDIKINPLTYESLKTNSEVHAVGTVWTTMLNEVLWNLIDISGRTLVDQLIASPNAGTGNTDFIKILIQAMKFQPCNPNFVQAKQAILDAEKLLFNGKYSCAIHAGFAKRGLGAYATSKKVNDFNVPVECGGVIPSPVPSPTGSPVDTCTHSVCKTGAALTEDCNACAAAVCAADSYCCTISWDSICVGEVSSYCDITC